MSQIFFAFMLFILSSCVTAPRAPRVYLGSAAYLKLPQPSEIPAVKAVQIISVKKDGQQRNFEAIFESGHNVIAVSVVSPLWPTPMKATYDGKNVTADGAMKKNIPFDFEYVIADLMVIYADAEVLRRNLNAEAKLITSPKSRRIVGVKDERTIVDVNFDAEDPFKGSIRLANVVRGYELEIKTLKAER